MSGRYTKVVVVVTALAALALIAAPATARKLKVIHYSNAITIELKNTQGQDKVSGAVTSRKAACIASRKVQIVESVNEQPVPLATVLTKSNGTYAYQPPAGLHPGYYYLAVIQQKRIFKTKKRKGLCSGAQSTPAPVTGP